MAASKLPPELLQKVLWNLPKEDLTKAVPLVCKKWRDVARSLHSSLCIPIILDVKVESSKPDAPDEISELLKKTTKLKKLAIKNIAVTSKSASIDFLPLFLVSQLQQIDNMWRYNFPESMSTFTMNFKTVNCLVQRDDRIHFDKAVLSHFQKISGLLHFQLETIFVDRMEVMAEFCRTESNCQKGLTLSMEDVQNSAILGKFLNYCSSDNLQKIHLWNCNLSKDCILTLKTLLSLKDLSLRVTGDLEDVKFLFDGSCQLRDLDFLEVGMYLDAEAVRNVGVCCGNSLRSLSIGPDVMSDPYCSYYLSASQQYADGWTACLEYFRALEECKFCNLKMSTERWASLFGRDGVLKNLKVLELSRSDILSASTFANIAKFSGDTLKKLNICMESRPLISPEECAEHVRSLHALEELDIGVGCFRNCSDRTQFFNKLFGTESQLTRLKTFRLVDQIYLNESLVASLESCCGKKLKTLDLCLGDRKTPDVCLRHLKHFSKLEVLAIRGSSGTVPSFSSVAWSSFFDEQSELNNLRHVNVGYNANVDDNCLKNLAKLCRQNLKKLEILHCKKVTEFGTNFVKEMCGSDIELIQNCL